MHSSFVMFAYLSPDTVLPVTSVVATVFGVVMMFGRLAFRPVARWVRYTLIRAERRVRS